MQSCFQDDTTEIYSTYNEGKSAVAVRFARTLKTKIYKRITLVPKNGYVDNLHRMFNKCYNAYHRAIKISLLMLKIIVIFTLVKKLIRKILNLKLMIM